MCFSPSLWASCSLFYRVFLYYLHNHSACIFTDFFVFLGGLGGWGGHNNVLFASVSFDFEWSESHAFDVTLVHLFLEHQTLLMLRLYISS